MWKKSRIKICFLLTLAMALPAMAFDLEDYATTYRATRDAYLKAANELKLATGPYTAAHDAYVAANIKYNASLGSPDDIRIAIASAKVRKNCLLEYKNLRDEYNQKFR